jgi:CHAT domain-containing protein
MKKIFLALTISLGIFLLINFSGIIGNITDLALANSDSSKETSQSSEIMARGLNSFQKGAFEEAIPSFKEAGQLFEKEKKLNEQIDALLHLSQAYQFIGKYRDALISLKSLLTLAKKSGDQSQIASILSNLGNMYLALGQADEAHQYLNRGMSIARKVNNTDLESLILNNLGNLYASQKQYDKAISSYMESIKLAKKTSNNTLTARAYTNAAMAHIKNEQYEDARVLLDTAFDEIQSLDKSHDKAYGLINIGLSYSDLRPHLQDTKSLSLLAYKAFKEAGTISDAISNPLASSYAWGNLSKLYEEEERYQEALQLTHRATFAAQQVNAPESLYRWQWQSGRLLKALGKMDEAIAAYRRAVDTLQNIRYEMATGYGGSLLTFRESMGPLYLELVDLLLKQAALTESREQYEPILLEAREVVELQKAAELRDYFRDDCVDAAQSEITRLDLVSKTAVVVYYILLPDRTELLVSLPSGMKRYTVDVGAETLTQEVRKFRLRLEKRTTREYLLHAQKLYEWLIRPIEKDMKSSTVDTLVFVPDGPLRTIPMAALHDGKEFLISKYALAVTPGLNLTSPRPIKREDIKSLAVGLTESVQNFPPLPFVDEELQAIQSMYGGNLLLNQDFLVSNVEKSLVDEQFNILHIASHGKFEHNVENTFLLTYDDKLTLDRLDQFVGLYQFREDPLDLLMLSACETAAGDDRAALGLAGVAIKAGAQSAIATLWYINDQASSLLVKEFYRQLSDPSVSRAVALQRAQLKLINDPRHQHPSYWSPFLLINNWL